MVHDPGEKSRPIPSSPTNRQWQNPRYEVLAAAEVYKIIAAAEALATDLDTPIQWIGVEPGRKAETP